MSDATLIVPILNGIDIYESIREDFNNAQVLPTCVYVGTHIDTLSLPSGLVTAGFSKTLGQVMESSNLSGSVLSVMEEIIQLAKKVGVTLPETIIADSYQKSKSFSYETKTSLQRDFEFMNKSDEKDLFGGAILRLGIHFEIDTPTTGELYDLLNRLKPL